MCAAEAPLLRAREEAGVPEHALVVHGALERTVHFDDDAVGGLEALAVVAVRVLVAAVLHALSQARVAILVRAAKAAEGPVEQSPENGSGQPLALNAAANTGGTIRLWSNWRRSSRAILSRYRRTASQTSESQPSLRRKKC